MTGPRCPELPFGRAAPPTAPRCFREPLALPLGRCRPVLGIRTSLADDGGARPAPGHGLGAAQTRGGWVLLPQGTMDGSDDREVCVGGSV